MLRLISPSTINMKTRREPFLIFLIRTEKLFVRYKMYAAGKPAPMLF